MKSMWVTKEAETKWSMIQHVSISRLSKVKMRQYFDEGGSICWPCISELFPHIYWTLWTGWPHCRGIEVRFSVDRIEICLYLLHWVCQFVIRSSIIDHEAGCPVEFLRVFLCISNTVLHVLPTLCQLHSKYWHSDLYNHVTICPRL